MKPASLHRFGMGTPVAAADLTAMAKLCILTTSTVLSYATWYGAEAVGCGFMLSFVISGIGAIAGCVVGWKLFQRYFD